MKLYLAHSGYFDYQTELYTPLKRSIAKDHDIFFPHDEEHMGTKSKDIIAASDLVLAEVSFPSTGQGIELGWADASGVMILCFYRSGVKPSRSLKFVADDFLEYSSTEDMQGKLKAWLDRAQ